MNKQGLLWLVCLAMGLALFAAPFSAVAGQSYVNGIDANYPPFAYVDESGEPSGFDVDAVEWIAEEMGFEVTHMPIDWDGIIPALKSEKIDFIASGMSITEKRKEQVDFTIPYWKVKKVLVAQQDTDLSVEEIMSGKRLGVQRGTTSAEWLKSHQDDYGYTLRYYDSAPMAVADVVNGRIQAAAMDMAPAKDAESEKPVTILGTFGMKSESFGYAVRKGDEELLQTLNEGLRKLMDDPYWDKLVQKYEPGGH
ncbi:MAG: transporter substrate-binding domain-containing protein [Desulfohalobiaceae bacterium]|nr:transporter substrate-binding domain-containing protein [Desulfohalobiaceae bacterium]